jgi:TRAP-type C4-dicarboxylate transport system substrate-binding protein
MKLLSTALLAVAALGAGCGGGGKSGGRENARAVVLTLANHEEGDQDTREFIAAVKALSQGSMRIELKPGWRLKEVDYDRGTIADLRSGKVDLAKIGVRSLDELGDPAFQPLMAPLLVDSLPLERRVLTSRLARTMLASVHRLGVEGVTFLPGELRRPFASSRPFRSAGDYRGATIGIRPSLVASWTFAALGAHARSYVPAELPRSFDGAELDLTTIVGNRYDRKGSALTANVTLWPRAFVVVGNTHTLRRLTRKQRRILFEAGRAALAPAMARLRSTEQEAHSIICARRQMRLVVATPEQLASLQAAVRPVYRRLGASRAALTAIAAMKRGLAAERVAGCSARPGEGEGRSTLDGVYEVDISRADLIAAKTPPGDVVPENWGHWVYVLSGNRIAFTQEDDEACTWAYGQLAVKRGTMAWSILDGGYTKAPNLAYNRAGESMRFRWSVYRDTLTLTPVEGEVSPPNFRARPWHRVSTKPSRSFFSKECPPPAKAIR